MTVSEAKGSCEGGSFTSHRGELGKSLRSEGLKTEQKNDLDHLSEQVSNISLDESKNASHVETEIEEKLGKLSISSVQPIDDEITNEKSDETTEATEGKGKSLQLNITERSDGVKENDEELKDENKIAEKGIIVLELNLIDNGDEKCKDGKDNEEEDDDGAKREDGLCPRSPMRPEHGNGRHEPYQVKPRNVHYSSGGCYSISEQNNFTSNDQIDWTTNLNICSQLQEDTSIPSPSSYPFSSATVPAENADEGYYNSSPENNTADNEELVKLVFDGLIALNIDLSYLGPEHPSIGPSCSPIPVSVEEFYQTSPVNSVTNSATLDYSPGSVSSGYNSSGSFRSTNSTPSPSSSVEGSEETIYMGFSEPPYHPNIISNGYDAPSSLQTSPALCDSSSVPANHQNSSIHVQTSDYFDKFKLPDDVFESLLNLNSHQPCQPKEFTAPKLKRVEPNPTFSLLSGTERLIKKMDNVKKSKTWAHISTIQDQDLAEADADGDTQLMILLLQEPSRGCSKLELIYAIVERLKRIDNALTSVNGQGQSALYLAALHCADSDADLITRYIAETLLSMGASLDTNFVGGDSLLHCLCRQGGKHFSVLRELLSLNNNKQCFQLDKFNDRGMTPLHVAASSHQGSQLDCTKMIRLLINAGANATLLTKDNTHCSALDLAIEGSCDLNLVEALLTSPAVVALCKDISYRQDTVLHLVAKRNDLPLPQQCRVFKALVERKARRDARDSKGKLPFDLVAPERREEIKRVIQQSR